MDYKIEHVRKIADQRGQLVVFLRNSELDRSLRTFGQIYFVTFDGRDVVRGNHYHKGWNEWFGVIHGRLQVRLRDMETGEEKAFVLDGDSDQYVRLYIGSNVAHAFKSLSASASLLNYTDLEWSPDDTFPMELLT